MGPLCSPNRARCAGHLPPLPPDKPSSRDHPCSFPVASFVYGTYQGFGQPAVARLSFGLGREGVAFTVPGVPETVRSIFQIWRHTQLVTGEPPPSPRVGVGRGEGTQLGEGGREAAAVPRGVRARVPGSPATSRLSLRSSARGAAGPAGWGAGAAPLARASPPQGARQSPRPGRTTRATLPTPAPRTLPDPLSIEFSNKGARQWSCSGMHTQLTAGGG